MLNFSAHLIYPVLILSMEEINVGNIKFESPFLLAGGIVNNTLRPLVPGFCDAEWKLLMEQCWAPDPTVRPSFTEIARRLRVMSAACQTKPQQNQVAK